MCEKQHEPGEERLAVLLSNGVSRLGKPGPELVGFLPADVGHPDSLTRSRSECPDQCQLLPRDRIGV